MKKIIVVAGLLLIMGSCYNDKYNNLYPATATSTTCDTAAMSYSKDIAPIITQYCAINGGCHNASGDAQTNGLDYTIFSVLQSQATTALMVDDILGTPTKGNYAMPLNLPAIPACDINKIIDWVNEGAPNN